MAAFPIHFLPQFSPLTYTLLTLLTTSLFLTWTYRKALPNPLPGIPYNEPSAHRLFGDVPSMRQHIAASPGQNFATYLLSAIKTLNAPLIQVFFKPFGRPFLILCDMRETRNIMLHRKDFDRSTNTGDKVKGIAPDHHLRLRTNEVFKAHRSLVQDLMTPSFLYTVAGPVMHSNAVDLMHLWRLKARIADGRPWEAGEDINHAILDAVMSFAFGERFKHSATKPTVALIEGLGDEAIRESSVSYGKEDGLDGLIHFPSAKVSDVLQAITDLSATIGQVRGALPPSLVWAYIMRKPSIKRATKVKEEYFLKELQYAVSQLSEKGGDREWSAIHHMILRERSFAQKEGRQPEYFSRVMFDEVSMLLSPFTGRSTRY